MKTYLNSNEDEKNCIVIHLYVRDGVRVRANGFSEFDVGKGVGESEGGR